MGATTHIPIDEFMAKGERDEKVVLRYHNARDTSDKAAIAHEVFANYIANLGRAREANDIVKYFDSQGNKAGPDLIIDDLNHVFASGRGIVEVKSLELTSSRKAQILSKASRLLKEALDDLRKYLNGKQIDSRSLGSFMPDFGLAVSEIFNKANGDIYRTIIVVIRNADGSYSERNWREGH